MPYADSELNPERLRAYARKVASQTRVEPRTVTRTVTTTRTESYFLGLRSRQVSDSHEEVLHTYWLLGDAGGTENYSYDARRGGGRAWTDDEGVQVWLRPDGQLIRAGWESTYGSSAQYSPRIAENADLTLLDFRLQEHRRETPGGDGYVEVYINRRAAQPNVKAKGMGISLALKRLLEGGG